MMAVANTTGAGCAVQLKAIEVCQALQEGEKFIKWDEDSGNASPVTLRVDEKGYYLYWVDQNHEMDLLDIATIRDVRTGSYAKIPKDPKLRPIVTMGSQDTLEEKTVTICSGSDFVNVTFINFCCTKKEIAQLWTDELFKMAYNLTQINSSTISFLQKIHTKLSLMVDKTGKIPIKNIVKLFAQNKDDKKKVEKALDTSGLPSGKNDIISPSKFQFEDFFTFYKNLTQRSEVEKVFDQLVGTSKRRLMSTSLLVDFLNRSQRDPRLNEILHPYADAARAKEVIRLYEPNKFNAQKGQLSFDGFLRYLMSDDNPAIAHSKLDLSDDMEQPLAHYFINSSHNTYLTGHQLTGKSSVEIYRQSLLAGCRCVELDFWNSRTEEPVIVHGYTFVPEISAKDVLEAIAESAFKTSDYPVILSFENHCNQKQQAKIANYCREIFGEMLLEKPMESHQLEPGGELPPPSMLKRKIIIKNKKKHHHHHHHKKIAAIGSASVDDANPPVHQGNGDIGSNQTHQLPRQASKESSASSDSDSSFEDDAVTGSYNVTEVGTAVATASEKAQQAKETEAGAEISALVNYVQPVHFSSFENSEKKNRYYEMSSFDEKQATTLLKERPIEFVNYNKHQLSRVYPAGTRFDSSNFMPQVFWNAGCQLVALNYQTLDLAMQLNLGTFEYNRRCGYLLKPEFMRRRDRRLDPFAESTVDGIIAGSVSVTVLSGQFLTDKRTGTYVEVDMYGLPADTVRKKFRTRIVPNNGLNPVYGEDPFVFKKVVLPDLASIRLAAYEEGGKIIGHRVLPVIGLCPGYRHVNLRNELNQPLPMASLFLLIVVKDYVPDGMSDFAEALANPIKYQSELEKREVQLAVLTDDLEPANPEPGRDDSALQPATVSRRETLAPQKQASVPSEAGAAGAAGASAGGAWSPAHRASVGGLAPPPPPGLPSAASSPNLAPPPSPAPPSADEEPAAAAATAATAAAPDADQLLEKFLSEEARAADAIRAEPLERALQCKAARAARQELRRKLEALRRKHDKERRALLAPHSHSKFRLAKRLSAKNILAFHSCESQEGEGAGAAEGAAAPAAEAEAAAAAALAAAQAAAARELCERLAEAAFLGADKHLRRSHAAQMQALAALLERETAHVMRRLAHARQQEVKALAKVHRDRDSLVRVKREVAAALVERGVAERERLSAAYEKRRIELQREHDKVRQQLEVHRREDKIQLLQEYDIPLNLSESGANETQDAIPEVSSVQESHNSGLVS